MAEQASPLIMFYKQGWQNYQQAFVTTIAPLTSEQLALPVAPQYVSIGGLLAHMIGARVWWFHQWMGEGDPELLHWHDDEQSEPEATELVAMFEKTCTSLLTLWSAGRQLIWNTFFHLRPW